MHSADVVGDEFHRSRAIECDHGDHMGEFMGLHLHDIAGHPVSFKLEHACGVPLTDELKNIRIIRRNRLQVKRFTVALLDQIARSRHDRQGDQSQKVNFEQAEKVHNGHLILRHRIDRAILRLACRSMQGDILDNWLVRDDDPSSMRAGIAYGAFHFTGSINQLPIKFCGIIELA